MKPLLQILLLSFLVSPAYAVSILNIKNDKVLLDLQDEELAPGERLIARNADGKGKALLEVKQVKGNKAIAVILKGEVEKEFTLAKRTPKKEGEKEDTKEVAKEKDSESDRKSVLKLNADWGVTAGMGTNSMTVKSTASSATLVGTSPNLSAFYQRQLDEEFSTRLFAGYHAFQVSGTSSICSGGNCSVDISYLGLEALVRYAFVKKANWQFNAGAGLGFLFPITKSSNIVNTSKITTNQTLLISMGLDWKLGKNSFMPIQLDYALFPDNSTSSANQMILRLGYGKSF